MNGNGQRIVILGAGFGGLTLAEELDRLAGKGNVQVTLVDGKDRFNMGFSIQWTLMGRREPQEGNRSYHSLQMRNIRFVQDEILGVDTGNRTIQTKSTGLEYDHLVIAVGAKLDGEKLPGLSGAGYDLHDMDSVLKFRSALAGLERGTVLVMVSSLPFKCPPAPYEYAMLIDDLLSSRGVRDDVNIVVSTPEPQPIPLAGKEIGEQVVSLLAARNIEVRSEHKPVSVDRENSETVFENGATISYDLLGAVYPHRAPDFLQESGITDPSGFVSVELGSFETSVPGVYAVGDVASMTLPDGRPHPKAGVFAEAQASTLASSIAAEIMGGKPEPYEGKGTCYVDAGDETAAIAEAHLLAEGGPRFSFSPPSKEGLERKRQFEQERFTRWFGG